MLQLAEHKEGLAAQINSAYDDRRRLRNQVRTKNDSNDTVEQTKKEIAELSEKLKELRREVRLCEDIERRSTEMYEKLREANDYKKIHGKEKDRSEQLRGCR
jgi:uncharacterized membrane protein